MRASVRTRARNHHSYDMYCINTIKAGLFPVYMVIMMFIVNVLTIELAL